MKINKIILSIIATSLFISVPIYAENNSTKAVIVNKNVENNTLIINGTLVPVNTYIENEQLMIPLRKSAELLGFDVEYDNERRTINLNNGIVKTTLTVGVDSYFKASSKAIGLTQAKPLGAAPKIVDGVTYIPAIFYNLMYSNDNTVIINDNIIVINTNDTTNDMASRKIEFNIGDKKHTISLELPDVIKNYITIEKLDLGYSDTNNAFALKFVSGDKVANVASIYIYDIEKYEKMKKENGPIPLELIRDNESDIIVAFSGLQSNPFEAGSEEANIIDKYQSEINKMIYTIKLK